jgi:hypothetical protein
MERSRSLSPMVRKWLGQKAGPRVRVRVKPLRVFPISSWLTLLDRAAVRAPWELPFRDQNARHDQVPWRPAVGAVQGGPAPPLRAGYQSVRNPPRGGASLTFRYCCGSSLSCRGATGRSGCGSVSSACQGLCVPGFYGHPRACPLKRIHRLG